MKRRNFLQAGAAAFTVHAFPYELLAGDKKYASDRIKLGPKHLELSRMAMGTGTGGWGGSSNQTRALGVNGLADLLRAAYDENVNFWDSADQYGSHPHLKAALRHVPREKVVIMTKTLSHSAKDMKADLDRFRREIGTDYLDIVLLHAESAANWPQTRKGAMDVLSQAQVDGIVKTVGISCHSIGALRTASENPWVEVDLVRLNPAGIRMDADVPVVVETLKQMKQNGKGIIGMKVMGLGQIPDRLDECLEFALGGGILDCFTLGCENEQQFRDLLQRIPAASVRA